MPKNTINRAEFNQSVSVTITCTKLEAVRLAQLIAARGCINWDKVREKNPGWSRELIAETSDGAAARALQGRVAQLPYAPETKISSVQPGPFIAGRQSEITPTGVTVGCTSVPWSQIHELAARDPNRRS